MGQFIDMTGWIMKEHGVPTSRLKVLKKNTEKYHPIEWWCQCECGKIFSTRGTAIRNGTTKSCGCWASEHAKQIGIANNTNLINRHFGRLIVLEDTGKRANRQIIWKCQCSCGNIIEVTTDHLKRGGTASCGCAKYSIGEENIHKILKANNIHYISNSRFFPDLLSENGIPLRYDFILLDDTNQPIRIIEFDGPQHKKSSSYFGGEQSFKILQYHDNLKNEYAHVHNIPLIRIPYKERNNISLEMLMSDKYLIA